MEYSIIEKEIEEFKPQMNSGKRAQRYAAGKKVDHLPYTLHLPDYSVCQILGHKTIEMERDINVYFKVHRYNRDVLGLEGINHRLSLRTMGAALGSKQKYPEDGFDILTDRVLEDYSDFNKIENLEPWDNEILTPFLERGKKIRDEFPNAKLTTGVVCPLSTAVAIRPIEKIFKDTIKDKKNLHKLLSLCVEHNLTWANEFTKEFGSGSASISGPLMSTDILSHKAFEEFAFPYLNSLVEGLKQITGFKPSLHICGYTKGIWNDIKKLDISNFSVDNVEDLNELKNEMGETLPILGNVEPLKVMRYGSPQDVIEAVKTCILKGADSPMGYILGTGCQIPPGTPEENLKTFVWAARKYGAGAIKGELPVGMKDISS